MKVRQQYVILQPASHQLSQASLSEVLLDQRLDSPLYLREQWLCILDTPLHAGFIFSLQCLLHRDVILRSHRTRLQPLGDTLLTSLDRTLKSLKLTIHTLANALDILLASLYALMHGIVVAMQAEAVQHTLRNLLGEYGCFIHDRSKCLSQKGSGYAKTE